MPQKTSYSAVRSLGKVFQTAAGDLVAVGKNMFPTGNPQPGVSNSQPRLEYIPPKKGPRFKKAATPKATGDLISSVKNLPTSKILSGSAGKRPAIKK